MLRPKLIRRTCNVILWSGRILACAVFIVLAQSYVLINRLNSGSFSCQTSETKLLKVESFSFDDSSSAQCHSTLLHENEREVKKIQWVGSKREIQATSQNKTDILVFIMESLSIQKFREEMTATHSTLNEAEIVWFESFHHRLGTTRANIAPLVIGEPVYQTFLDPRSKDPKIKREGAHRKGIPYFLINRLGNYSAIFDVPESFMSSRALWSIAKRHGYHTLHGSTACNMFMGLHRIATRDGNIFYDYLDSKSQYSAFDSAFPLGSFYTKNETECTNWSRQWEAANPEDVLKCNSRGPYHHKFLDFYKKFKGLNSQLPLFTITQLYETHGFTTFWPLDFHVSQFFKWLLDKKDTLIIFMGDHGDESGTPLGVILPRHLHEGREELRKLSREFVVSENIYEFLRTLIETKSVMNSTKALKREIFQKNCESYEKLAVCLCENSISKKTEIIFNASFVSAAVTYIQGRSGIGCSDYKLKRYDNIKPGAGSLSFDLHFENHVIFEATFRSIDDFHVAQRTRYVSQASCTPEPIHPEFCLCDATLFKKDNL